LGEAAAAEGAELERATARQGQLRSSIAERQAAIDSVRVEAHDAELEILGAERDLRLVDLELQRIGERREEIAKAESEGRGSLSQVDVDEGKTRRELADAQHLIGEAQERVRVAESVLIERRRVVEEQSAKATEVKVQATEARERADRERSVIGQLDRSIAELDAREDRLREDVDIADRELGQAVGRILLHRGRLSETAHDAAVAREELSDHRGRYDEAQMLLGQSEAALKELRSTIDKRSTELNALTLRERELTMSLEHLEEQVQDKHRIELAYVIGDHHARPVPDAAITARAEELQGLIDRMG
jgi:chromosome segregation protein